MFVVILVVLSDLLRCFKKAFRSEVGLRNLCRFSRRCKIFLRIVCVVVVLFCLCILVSIFFVKFVVNFVIIVFVVLVDFLETTTIGLSSSSLRRRRRSARSWVLVNLNVSVSLFVSVRYL